MQGMELFNTFGTVRVHVQQKGLDIELFITKTFADVLY